MSSKANVITLKGSKRHVSIGGNAPISVQTMLKKPANNIKANVEQAKRCQEAGAEIIRFSVPDEEALKTLEVLVKEIEGPIVADIHFDHNLACSSARVGAAALRINPGNIGGFEKTAKVVDVAKECNCVIRVGVNAGSLEEGLSNDENLTFCEKLATSALRNVEFIENECNFCNLVVSIKASDVNSCIEANMLFHKKRCDVPLHIGITEAGTFFQGVVKNSVGIGILLNNKIGNTIRVSLSDEPENEVRAAWHILSSLDLRRRGVEIVSCPTCARCQVDMIRIANEVQGALENMVKPIQVAVMGCVVNGPGEAKNCDIGVACGKASAVLFKNGKIIRKVSESEIVGELLDEISKM